MTYINTITDSANQALTLVLSDGTNANFSMWYSDGQQGWYYSITYGNFSVTNRRIITGVNLLRSWRNIIPFGLAVTTIDGYEPIYQEDFSNGRASLYLLNASDVINVEGLLVNAQVQP